MNDDYHVIKRLLIETMHVKYGKRYTACIGGSV